jgi:hypothetical protein
VDTEQQGADESRDREGADDADGDADRRGLQPLFHHQGDHLEAIRAERHPDANLAAALDHHVRQHSVCPDDRQQQRQSRKCAEEPGQQPRLANRLREDVVHFAQAYEGYGRIDLSDGLFEGV